MTQQPPKLRDTLTQILIAQESLDVKQEAILKSLTELKADFNDHKKDDKDNFTNLYSISSSRDKNFNGLKSDIDKAKGAGWVILGIVSLVVALVGMAAKSAIEHLIHVWTS